MKPLKDYVGPVLVSAFAMVLVPGRAPAQSVSIIDTSLQSCGTKTPIVPRQDAKVFDPSRISATLNGVWRGRVLGHYPPNLVAPDGYLNVNYFMVVDTQQDEVLILEQLSPKRSAPQPQPGAPAWSFLTCGGQYFPPAPPQVHEFQKVSDNVEDARAILKDATGIDFSNAEPLVSGAWQILVDHGYFNVLRFPAFAGGLWKPFVTGNIQNDVEFPVLNMECQAEFRGGGITAALFQPGVPIRGAEAAQFVGVTIPGKGDFLVASLGNGLEWLKKAIEGGLINAFIDKVVIGPLAPAPFVITDVFFDAAGDEVTISWPSAAGKAFQVERSNDLKNWDEIGAVTATQNTSSFTDKKLRGSKTSRYYRVRRQRTDNRPRK